MKLGNGDRIAREREREVMTSSSRALDEAVEDDWWCVGGSCNSCILIPFSMDQSSIRFREWRKRRLSCADLCVYILKIHIYFFHLISRLFFLYFVRPPSSYFFDVLLSCLSGDCVPCFLPRYFVTN